MRRRTLVHHHESARIYQQYYKPSLNIFRLLKSVLSVIITGTSAAAGTYRSRK